MYCCFRAWFRELATCWLLGHQLVQLFVFCLWVMIKEQRSQQGVGRGARFLGLCPAQRPGFLAPSSVLLPPTVLLSSHPSSLLPPTWHGFSFTSPFPVAFAFRQDLVFSGLETGLTHARVHTHTPVYINNYTVHIHINTWISGLVTFLVAMTNAQQKQLAGQRICFGSQFEGPSITAQNAQS